MRSTFGQNGAMSPTVSRGIDSASLHCSLVSQARQVLRAAATTKPSRGSTAVAGSMPSRCVRVSNSASPNSAAGMVFAVPLIAAAPLPRAPARA